MLKQYAYIVSLLKHIKLRDVESTVMDNILTYQLPKTLFHL